MIVSGLVTMNANANRHPKTKETNAIHLLFLCSSLPVMKANIRPPNNRQIKLMKSALLSPKPSRILSI